MSFIQNQADTRITAPGWFLVHPEDCHRETRQIPATGASTDYNGAKYVKMGTLYTETHTETVEGVDTDVTDYIGFVYEDVDVSSGDMPGSVVTKGTVYLDRLPAELTADAQTALVAQGFKFVAASPTVTRPY